MQRCKNIITNSLITVKNAVFFFITSLKLLIKSSDIFYITAVMITDDVLIVDTCWE